MNRLGGTLVLVGLIAMAPALSAQATGHARLGISRPSAPIATGWEHSFRGDSVQPNHWVTGMAIGAGVGLVIGYGVYRFAEELSESPGNPSPLLILGPMAVFGLIGAMIGSFSPRK
jgi:hypothetical protein